MKDPVRKSCFEHRYRDGRLIVSPQLGKEGSLTTGNQVYVGIDWGSRQHQVCVTDEEGTVLCNQPYEHQPGALGALGQDLRSLAGKGRGVRVAIETPRGPLIETLLCEGFEVYHLNPKQLDRFRDRFTSSGAKDDRRDAEVLASSLRTDPNAFHRVHPEDPKVVTLREWSHIHEELVQERVRLVHQFRQQLSRYHFRLLELGFGLESEGFLALFEAAPNPDQGKRLALRRIEALLRRHRLRRLSPSQVRQGLRQPPLSVSPATTAAAQAHAETLVPRIRLVNEQLRRAQRALDEGLEAFRIEEGSPSNKEKQHDDVTILQSVPGVGRVVLAVLLAEAHQALADRDYSRLRKRAGVAPITRQTGRRPHGPRREGSLLVLMRRACDTRLRTAVYHWARVAVQRDPHFKARYAALRSRGLSHPTALRVVGDGLLRLACALLRNRTLYQPEILHPASKAA